MCDLLENGRIFNSSFIIFLFIVLWLQSCGISCAKKLIFCGSFQVLVILSLIASLCASVSMEFHDSSFFFIYLNYDRLLR